MLKIFPANKRRISKPKATNQPMSQCPMIKGRTTAVPATSKPLQASKATAVQAMRRLGSTR